MTKTEKEETERENQKIGKGNKRRGGSGEKIRIMRRREEEEEYQKKRRMEGKKTHESLLKDKRSTI